MSGCSGKLLQADAIGLGATAGQRRSCTAQKKSQRRGGQEVVAVEGRVSQNGSKEDTKETVAGLYLRARSVGPPRLLRGRGRCGEIVRRGGAQAQHADELLNCQFAELGRWKELAHFWQFSARSVRYQKWSLHLGRLAP